MNTQQVNDIQKELDDLILEMGYNPSKVFVMPKLFSFERSEDNCLKYNGECKCCLNSLGVEKTVYQSEICLEEELNVCHICGIHYHFAYGHTTLSFEEIEWYWDYNIKNEDKNVLNMEVQIVSELYNRISRNENVTDVEKRYLSLMEERSRLRYEMKEGVPYA